jgi:hypothetical protein
MKPFHWPARGFERLILRSRPFYCPRWSVASRHGCNIVATRLPREQSQIGSTRLLLWLRDARTFVRRFTRRTGRGPSQCRARANTCSPSRRCPEQQVLTGGHAGTGRKVRPSGDDLDGWHGEHWLRPEGYGRKPTRDRAVSEPACGSRRRFRCCPLAREGECCASTSHHHWPAACCMRPGERGRASTWGVRSADARLCGIQGLSRIRGSLTKVASIARKPCARPRSESGELPA